MSKILVTGATGNVGKSMVQELIARKANVKAGVRDVQKAANMNWPGVELAQIDFQDPQSVRKAFAGIHALSLLVPPGGTHQEDLLKRAIDLAKEQGVAHIVFLSAVGADVNDYSVLGKVEKYIEGSGVPYTFLRPNWFMQNFNSFLLENILKQNAIYLPAADSKTSFIDTRDIGAVGAATLTDDSHIGKAYTLTGGEALDHDQVASAISKVSGRSVRYVPVSEEEAIAGLKASGWPEGAAIYLAQLYRYVREGWTAAVTPEVASILKREPIRFDQYARDYAQSWK
jgi:uncharacterized protein YbjT (DUF2867 family)